MNDASVMMSESLMERVDMTEFYDLVTTPTLFSCFIDFEDESVISNITGFKRSAQGAEITTMCSQEIASRLISGDTIFGIEIKYEENSILKIKKDSFSDICIDISNIQDANCKVKLIVS